MKFSPIILSFLFFIPLSKSQITEDLFHKGLNDIPIIQSIDLSKSRESISNQNIKNLLMPPRQELNSDESMYYALASALEYYINLNSNFKINLSPEFIHLHLPKEKQTLEKGLNFLKTDGTISAALLPYKSTKLNAAIYQAERYKIDSYLQLFREDFRERHKIFAVKKALLRGNPVIVTLAVNSKFYKLNYEDRFWYPEKNNQSFNYQTVIVTGYDEEEETFEIMNFQGSDWGNRGCILINYDDFGEIAKSGFVLVYMN